MKRKAFIAIILLCALLLAACGAQGGETVQPGADLTAIYDGVAQKAELPEMVAVPESRFERVFGLDAADCAQAVITVCADSVRVDEIWLVEAVDTAAAGRVAEAARARLEQRSAEMKSYLPDQYAVLEQAQLIEKGTYVAMFVSPQAAAMAETFLAAIAR